MNVRFHPLRPGEFPLTHTRRRQDLFDSPWSKTLDLLQSELTKLGANNAVISIAITEDEIRTDGWPRSTARPSHPGVIISFDSKFGPLRYLTDQFWDWQANIRAVALGLQSLRAVDRYGITKRGEQYTGWKQLTGSSNGPRTREQAEAIIRRYGSVKDALFKSHPDHGGDTEAFAEVQAARELLEATQ